MRMNKLKDKVIAVTGASSGIGAELVMRLADLGAIPVLIARRSELLAEVAGRITGDPLTLQADVTNAEQIEQAIHAIIARYGRIDGWVNNAGFGIFKPTLDMPMAE